MTERRYRYRGDEHRVSVRHSGSETSYLVDGQPSDAQVRLDPDGSVFVRLGGRTYRALVTVSKDHTDVCVEGFAFRLGHGDSAVFVTSPISAVLLALCALLFLSMALPALRRRRESTFHE